MEPASGSGRVVLRPRPAPHEWLRSRFLLVSGQGVLRGVVEIVAVDSGGAGHLGDSFRALDAVGGELCNHLSGLVNADDGARGPLDDNRDLPTGVLAGPLGQLAQTAAANLLVGLRQLPAHRGPSVGAEGISGVIKKISESVGASYRTVVRGS